MNDRQNIDEWILWDDGRGGETAGKGKGEWMPREGKERRDEEKVTDGM